MSPIALAVLAGIVQGVVEWLPVSSKTMITLIFSTAGYSFGTGYVLGLLANMGSFLAALWYFRTDIQSTLRGLRAPFSDTPEARLLRYLVLATLTTGIVGIPIYVLVEHALSAATGTAAMVAIGILLLATSAINARRERLARTAVGDSGQAAPGTVASLIIGACQGLAAAPGVSRSAVTVTPLLLRGYDATAALRFSFLLDVPALLGAGLLPIVIEHGGARTLAGIGAAPVIVLLAVSAIVSLLTIRTVLAVAGRLRSSLITLVIGVLAIASALAFGLR
ncbi:MAG TPA: undecaprenyl-diphosphate phosphatase [bacterium]|nr:undecaprenyl-diphosphate phosphatase [bacterium]